LALRAISAGPVSPGHYTVEVFGIGASDKEGVAARKFYVREG
jgi:hypothetical protein